MKIELTPETKRPHSQLRGGESNPSHLSSHVKRVATRTIPMGFFSLIETVKIAQQEAIFTHWQYRTRQFTPITINSQAHTHLCASQSPDFERVLRLLMIRLSRIRLLQNATMTCSILVIDRETIDRRMFLKIRVMCERLFLRAEVHEGRVV